VECLTGPHVDASPASGNVRDGWPGDLDCPSERIDSYLRRGVTRSPTSPRRLKLQGWASSVRA